MNKKQWLSLGLSGAAVPILFGWYAFQNRPLFNNLLGAALFVGVAALLTVAAVAVCYCIFIRRVSMQRIVLCVLALFCCISMFINTPGSVPDERSHLASVYLHSNRLLGWPDAQAVQGEEGLYQYVVAPVRYGDRMEMDWDIQADEMVRERTTEGAYRQILLKTDWLCKGEEAELTYVKLRNIDAPATGYFPAILGLTIGRLVGLGLYPSIMLARSFQLLLYVLIVFWSIRRIPIGKSALMVCSLLPYCMHLVPSLSYDSIILSLSFALITQLLYLAYGSIPCVDIKDVLLTALLAAVLAPNKYACYLVAALLVFLIPRDKFKWKHGRVYFFLLLLVIGLIGLLLFHADAISMALREEAWIPRDVSRYEEGGYNIALIVRNPGKVLWVFLYTLISNARNYVLSMVGAYLGFSAIRIDLWIIDGFLLCLLATRLRRSEKSRTELTCRERRILLAPALLCMLFFLFGMLLWETGFESLEVAGVQGRYFLPLLPAIMLSVPAFSLRVFGEGSGLDLGDFMTWRKILMMTFLLQSAAVLNQLSQVLAK